MFAFNPVPVISKRARTETLRMVHAAVEREHLAIEYLNHRRNQSLHTQVEERQAAQRSLKSQARRREKVQRDNAQWQLRALTAVDVREALNDTFKQSSQKKIDEVQRRLENLKQRRSELNNTLLYENQLRGHLLRGHPSVV